jgi:hypothetical protein
MATTVVPGTPVVPMLLVLAVGVAIAFAAIVPSLFRAHREGPGPGYYGDKMDWRTPRLTMLAQPPQTRGRRVLFWLLGAYLAVSTVLLVVRVAQLIAG